MIQVAYLCPESSATGMGQFPICKLKLDFLRTSVTACVIHKNIFSAPFGIENGILKKRNFKIYPIQPPNGVLPICKLPFPNGSYLNGVCRAPWA